MLVSSAFDFQWSAWNDTVLLKDSLVSFMLKTFKNTYPSLVMLSFHNDISFFEVPYITYSFLLKLFSQMCPPLPLILALSSVLPEFVLCSFLILQSADFKALPGRTLIYSLPQQIYTDGCTASVFKSSLLLLGVKTQRTRVVFPTIYVIFQ